MRRSMMTAFLLALAAGLVACGGTEDSRVTTSGPETTVAQTTSTSEATVDPALERYRVAVRAWQAEWGPKLTEWSVIFSALNDPSAVTESRWHEMVELIEVADESYTAFGQIEPPPNLTEAHNACYEGVKEVLRICGKLAQGFRDKDEAMIQEAYAEGTAMEAAMASADRALPVLEQALGFPLNAGPGD